MSKAKGRRATKSSSTRPRKRIRSSLWEQDKNMAPMYEQPRDGRLLKGDRRSRPKTKGHNTRSRNQGTTYFRPGGDAHEDYPYGNGHFSEPDFSSHNSNHLRNSLDSGPFRYREQYLDEPNWERNEEFSHPIDPNRFDDEGLCRRPLHDQHDREYQYENIPEYYHEPSRDVENLSAVHPADSRPNFPERFPSETMHEASSLVDNHVAYQHPRDHSPQRYDGQQWLSSETSRQPIQQPTQPLMSSERYTVGNDVSPWPSHNDRKYNDSSTWLDRRYEGESGSQHMGEISNPQIPPLMQASLEAKPSLPYSDRFAQDHHSMTNEDPVQLPSFREENQPPSSILSGHRPQATIPTSDRDLFLERRGYQIPSSYNEEVRSSPMLFSDRELVHNYEVEHRTKPVPLMSLPLNNPTHGNQHTTQPYQDQSTSPTRSFCKRQNEQSNPPILSRLGREVSSDVDYNYKYPLSTSPRNDVVPSSSSNHILSRLGPRATDYGSENCSNRSDHLDIESYQQPFRMSSDNGSAFSRLGPEAHSEGTLVPVVNDIAFSNDSHNSLHMSEKYDFPTESQHSRQFDMQSSRITESPSILSRLGEPNHAFDRPDFDRSNHQPSPHPHCHPMHVATHLGPLDVEEQQSALALVTSAFDNALSRSVSSEVYSEYAESPRYSQSRDLVDELNSVHHSESRISPRQGSSTATLIPVSLPFSSMQDEYRSTGQSFCGNTSPRDFLHLGDDKAGNDCSVNKHSGNKFAHVKQLTQDHVGIPAEPSQEAVGSGHLLGGNDISQDNVLNLAQLVLGPEIANHLGASIKQLFNAVSVVEGYLAKERRTDSNFPTVLERICSHFNGFFSGTLKTAHLPANSKLFFTKELGHLRSECGRDIRRWRKRTQQYIALADTIPSLLHDVLSCEENCCSASDRSMSPQPLVVDEGEGTASPSSMFDYTQEDSVGYRPTTKHYQASAYDTSADAEAEVTKSAPHHFVGYRPISEHSDLNICEATTNIECAAGSSTLHQEVNDTSQKEESTCPSRHSSESSSSHPGSSLGCRKQKELVSASRYSVESSRRHSASSQEVHDKEPVNNSRYSVESSEKKSVHSPVKHGRKNREEPVSTTEHLLQSSRKLSANSSMKQDDIGKDLGELMSVETGPDGSSEALRTSNYTVVTSQNNSPESASVGRTASSQLLLDGSRHDSLSHPITSKIPVNSAERTAEGLQSLLHIVNSGALKDSFAEFQISTCNDDSVNKIHSSEQITSPLREHWLDTEAVSLSMKNMCEVGSKEIGSPTTTGRIQDLQCSLEISTKMSDSSLVPSSLNLSDQQQTAKSTPQDKTTHLDQSSKRGSLSPGEIVSSPSPSPPPPSSRRNSDRRGSPSRSYQSSRESRRTRSYSSGQLRSRRQYSMRSRSPPRSYSYQSRRRPGKYGIHTRVNRRYKKDRVSPHRSNSQLHSSSSSRRYNRRSSESEDELELLDLRKKAILSMIPENFSKKAAHATFSASSKESSTRPSRIITKEQKPSASGPISGSQDNFDAVDMDVCDSHSDSGAHSPSEHTSPKTSTLESCSTVNTTESELTKDGLAIDTPSELIPLDSKVSPSETVSASETSAPLTTGTAQEESDGTVLTVAAETNQKHSPRGDNTTAGTDQEDSLEVGPARITGTDQDGSSSGGVVGATASREQSPSFSVKILPGNEKTWSIEPVHILPDDDSDSEDGGTVVEGKSPAKPISDISQFLLQARKASVDSHSRESAASPSPTPTTLPLSLPTSKKKEYLQLKMKLEMHERKKRLKSKPVHKKLTQLRKPSLSSAHAKKSVKPRTKVTPPGSQLTERELVISILHRTLSGYEKELQSYQCQQEKNQSELTSLTEQLTECELTIEEWDLKLSALEAQLKSLQTQIKTSKAAQSEAHKKKASLQTNVRTVKEKCSKVDSKIKEIASGISQTKDSIAKHQSSSKPSSISVPEIVVSSGKTASTVNVEPRSEPCVPEIITEPVSDCDTATSSPLPVIEVEPITDSEFSDSPNCQPSCTQSSSLHFEVVSDVEMDTIRGDVSVSSDSSAASTTFQPLSSTSELPRNTHCTSSLLTGSKAVQSIPAAIVESSINEPEEVMVSAANSEAIAGGDGLAVRLGEPIHPVEILPSSKEAPFVASSLPGTQPLQVDISITPKLGVDHCVPSSFELSVDHTACSTSSTGLNQLTSQSNDENLIPTDKIFCLGTCDLFTLGFDDQPQLVVPVDNLQSLSSLNVDAVCISQPVLAAVQERSTQSYRIRTGCEYSTAIDCQRNDTDAIPTLTVCGSTAEYPGTARPARARKQKKPLKLTPERRHMLFGKEQHPQSQADETSSIVCEETCSSNASIHGVSGSYQESTGVVQMIDSQQDDKQTQAQDTEKMKVSSSPQSNSENLPAASTVDKITHRGDGEAVDVRIVSLLQHSFQQAFPQKSPLSSHEAQEVLNSSSHLLPTQVSATLHPPSMRHVGSVLDSVNFFQSQSFSTTTKLPSSFTNMMKSTVNTRKRSAYTPYSSPLLCFNSYILSPAYRQHEKLQLRSLTHSNKLDPKQLLCKYEMFGVCKDPKCTAQHVRDSALSTEEMIASLVGYAPQLANCSSAELEEAEEKKPSLKKHILDKLSSYSSSIVKQYSPKISDEEMYKLTAHEVNKARKIANPQRHKHHFISFSDSNWLQPDTKDSPETAATSSNLRIPDIDLSLNEGDAPNPTQLVYCSSDKSKSRYFAINVSTKKTAQASNTPPDDTVENILERAVSYEQQKNYKESLKVLEDGVKKHNKSLDLWIKLLHLYSQVIQAKPLQAHELSLRDVCSRALDATSSYTAVLECIRAGRTVAWKQEWISRGVECVLSAPSSTSTSHQCLELLMNSVLLYVSLGRMTVALGTLEGALFGFTEKPFETEFKGVCEHLSLEDRQMACVCLLHLLYWQQIPSGVFRSPNTALVPSKIVCKTCCVKWDGSKTLSPPQSEAIRQHMQKSWHLCKLDTEATAESIAACLPLLTSMVGFEVTHGNYPKAFSKIEGLIESAPTVVELWLLYAKNMMAVQTSPDSEVILNRALTACPHDAQLYYFAARLELLALSSDSKLDVAECSQRAIEWLERCIRSFYKSPTSSVDSSHLYRKLLGQFVPYDLKLPPLADSVDPKNLDSQHAALWMCYCLLVELTAESSPSGEVHHQTAVDVYESAIHSLLDRDSSIAVWKEYLSYLGSVSLSSSENMNLYLNCTRRCLQAVEFSRINSHTDLGQLDHYEDYRFHNEVIDSFLSRVKCTPSQKLSLLQSFGSLLPNNSDLTIRIVSCALEQEAPSYEVAQSLLATHLKKAPYNVLLWRLAAWIEIKLGHSREARWIYRQATDTLSHCLPIWSDFLMFELNQCLSRGSDSEPLLVTAVLSRAHQCGVDFNAAF